MEHPYIAVAAVGDIAPGKFLKVTVRQRDYLIANVDGRFFAVEDLCSHEDYPLSYGCVEGERIKCSLHGSRFSLVTGIPLDEPAAQPIATFPVAVENGQVWIDPRPATAPG